MLCACVDAANKLIVVLSVLRSRTRVNGAVAAAAAAFMNTTTRELSSLVILVARSFISSGERARV